MPLVVGVAFKPVTKVYYFDPAEFTDLTAGERVVVDTARGRTLGTVVNPPIEVPASDISGALKPVVRRATALDMVQQDQQSHRESETLALCRQRADALRLDMKIIRVEFNFDGSSLLVYFTSEQRVDFRGLVHDLAQALHARVEMRQIGVRDEAKFLSGFGRCGRELCCASWLREFTPVSIKMAKQQDLPLNPTEISGVCGRLLCCLSYENEHYGEARRHLPKINSTLMTPEGPGRVRQVHVLRNTVTVQVQGPNDEKMLIEVPITPEDITEEAGPAPCENCPGRKRPVIASDEVQASNMADEVVEAQGLETEEDAGDADAGENRRREQPAAQPGSRGKSRRRGGRS